MPTSVPTNVPAPIIVAAGLIWRDGRVLLTRRGKGHLAGYWEFPGGKVEPGEDPEAALMRECREECAIDIEVEGIYEVVFHRYPEKDVLLLFYRCVWRRFEVENLEVEDHVWCDPRHLDRYRLPPADERLLARLREERHHP